MSSPRTPARQSAEVGRHWHDLFSLNKRAVDDRRILTRQLEAWCRRHGLTAGLYSDGEGSDGNSDHQLLVCWGSEFPRSLERRAVGQDGDRQRLPLPGVLILHDTSEAVDAVDPELLMLAAGARISYLKEQVQEQRFQAKFRGVELEALYDVGLAIASTLDLEKLCDEALLRAVSLLDARRGALYLLDDDGSYQLTSRFGGVALDAFAPQEIDIEGLTRGALDCPSKLVPGGSHLLAVAVEIDGNPRGLLVVADKESRRGVGPFPSTDRRTLALFANQAAIAIENAKLHKMALEKERLEREMELAAEIQSQLLPKAMPTVPGFEVMGWNRPARQVGGDYFDLQPLGKGHWGLVVGDVTGKGLPAALLVSTLHSALRLLLDRLDVGPALLDRLNRHIFESSSSNKFITMLIAAIDTDSGKLTYLNAGHNPGLVVRHDGSVEQLHSSGLPLGLMAGVVYEEASLQLGHQDLVCLYSDGITECESPEEEELGLERLIELLVERRREPLPEIVAAIDRTVVDFAQGRPQGDDQTVVLLRRCPA